GRASGRGIIGRPAAPAPRPVPGRIVEGSMASASGLWSRPLVRWSAVIVLDVVVVGAVALAAVRGWPRARAWEQAGRVGPASGDGWWKNECAGVRLPPTRTPEESGLADREEVFGVVAGGRARAYRLAALSLPSRHVVNDVVGGTPVTVAFCDRT